MLKFKPTELDYYGVLNIRRNAKLDDITLAYRKLAMRLCPDREALGNRGYIPLANDEELTHMSALSLTRQWEYINMAYDVLSNDLLRAIYDRYGEAGLFQGVQLPNGVSKPYQYDGDHMRVFHKVFDNHLPYGNIVSRVTGPNLLYTTKENGIGMKTRSPPQEKDMELDLKDVYFGVTKLMHIKRQELVEEQTEMTKQSTRDVYINVPPGTVAGTRFVFKEAGDQKPDAIAADVVFVAVDKPHPCFKRQNTHDLLYTHKIDLCEALIGFNFIIRTLDGRQLKIKITDVVYPGYTKIIPGEGLPKCKVQNQLMANKPPSSIVPHSYGDLYIKFDVSWPVYLTKEMKQLAAEYFNDMDELQKEFCLGNKK